jgi:hypothetical protein
VWLLIVGGIGVAVIWGVRVLLERVFDKMHGGQ